MAPDAPYRRESRAEAGPARARAMPSNATTPSVNSSRDGRSGMLSSVPSSVSDASVVPVGVTVPVAVGVSVGSVSRPMVLVVVRR